MHSERKNSAFLLLYFLSILLLIIYGCGSDEQDTENTDEDRELVNGWNAYNEANYEAAILSFEKVISIGAKSDAVADAYNGLGWAYLGFSKNAVVNQQNISTALAKFQEAIKRNNTNADARVGQASALLIRRASDDDLLNAVKSIDSVLQSDAKYLYRHDYDSVADLYILKAQCHYYLDRPDEARNALNQALSLEKDNALALAIMELL